MVNAFKTVYFDTVASMSAPPMNFQSLAYLADGNPRQQAALAVLTRYAVFERLHTFHPVLAGTIPIAIDIESSDLDIICCWENKTAFWDALHRSFATNPEFHCTETIIHGQETVVAGCRLDGFELEFFGQSVPVEQQNAYRHLLIEHAILQTQDSSFRQQIIELKHQGCKTEPAFALLLGLDSNNPYQALLDFGQQHFGL